MDENSVKGGLVWGVPVRPDLLGLHLEAYKKAFPVMKALRLSHRFGKGPKVHVTKLPVELVLEIEDYIFDHHVSKVKTDWLGTFTHFERRCDPLDDLDTASPAAYCEIYPEVEEEDEVQAMLCEGCKKDGARSDCGQDCRGKVDENIKEGLYERGEDLLDACMSERDAWDTLIHQGPKGNFAKYDKILRKHFGLQAYFATTRAADGTPEQWPTHPNYKWHVGHPLETTICYLHLPCQMTGETMYVDSEFEGIGGFLSISGSQSYLVDLPTNRDREKRVDQFNKALRSLRLKPYVHASQLNSKVSAKVPFKKASKKGTNAKDHQDVAAGNEIKEKDESSSEMHDPSPEKNGSPPKKKEEDDAKKKKDEDTAKDKEMSKIQWPRLVMLMKTGFHFG